MRSVAVLQIGGFTESVIQALAGVFIARLLQPELFGVYALAFSLAGLVSLFLGVGVQDAISTVLGETYTRNDSDKTKEALAFLLKILVITGFIALLGAFFAPWIAQALYHNSRIGIYAAIVILAVIVNTTFFSLSSLVLQVTGKIRQMMILGIADQIARYGVSVALVFWGFGVLGGTSGHLIGAVIIFFVSLVVWEKVRRKNRIFPSLRRLFSQARTVCVKKYLGFSVWIAIDRNVANLYGLLPVLLTGIFVSSSEVTFFKLSFAYINLAMSLLGPISVLLNVEFPKMKVERGNQLGRNFIKVSLYSLGMSAVLTAAAIVAAPIAFKFFYGVNFLPSVKYVFGLFAYGALFGIGVGLGPMWRAINKVKTSILINAITLGIGVPLGLLLIKNLGVWGSVIMVTLWFTISHFVSFVCLAKFLKKANENNF